MAMIFIAFGASAQIPRLKTSAPPEKTAQPKGKKSSSDKNVSPPKDEVSKKETFEKVENKVAKDKKGSKKTPLEIPQKVATAMNGRYKSLKTNLAYDLFAVLNADFEIQVDQKITVAIPVIWSLWDWKRDLGLRIVAFQPEARYWFGEVGKGNALGVNFGIASYNFRKEDIRYQDARCPLLSASICYTYAIQLVSEWSLEFSLAVGYVNTKYNRYYNINNGALINTKTCNYFGPTKIGVNLCYRLGK